MGLFTELNIRENSFLPYLNTGTGLDIATGCFIPGIGGSMILNGGLSYTNSVVGRPQLFKSTNAWAYIRGALIRYIGSDCLIFDTEPSLNKQRLLSTFPEHLRNEMDGRIRLVDHETHKAESFMTLCNEIGAHKEKHKSDWIVETPFIDPRTGKAQTMYRPTFVFIDSWSKMKSAAVQKIMADNEVGSSETNMIYMKDGIVKTQMMSEIATLSVKYNIYFVLTAHVGDLYQMDKYNPTPKELQHMKSSDKLRQVGGDFTFLSSNLIEMRKALVLQNGDKTCLYPDQYSNPNELNIITGVLCRCKNNASGAHITEIISQQSGVLPGLSNYHYLKENKYYGLVGNNVNHASILLPEYKLGRTTIRDKLIDSDNGYKLTRALELTTQLHYIQTNWSMRDSKVNFMLPVEQYAEKLMTSSSHAIDDILNSRGYWTYDKQDPRPYLSVYDTLNMIEGTYTPKLKGDTSSIIKRK